LNTELEHWLQEKFNGACAVAGQSSFSSGLRISPPLAGWEEEFFQRGLNEELFAIDERGEVASELLPRGSESSTERRYRIFSREPIRLLRENLCLLAASARLIFEHGWLRKHVVIEPGRDEQRSSGDQFNLLVRSPTGEIFIWVEARRSAVELEKLIADLRACSKRGSHAQADCGFPQNHPRHEFCAANQPACLWAVAPDGEFSFAVKCNGPVVELEPLSELPPRSRFELS
jgi:hypothetical protein